MERDLERTSDATTQHGSGEQWSEEYKQYERQTRGKYKKLMADFEFRCLRADMMNYIEAAGYSKTMYIMEYLAAFLGAVSLTTIGAWFVQMLTDSWFGNISQLGVAFLVGVAAFIIEVISKGSTRLIPSFRYAQWYRALITERKKICSMGSILQSTYDKFNDPDRVLEPLKIRKESFKKYLELEWIYDGDFLG